MNNSLQKNKRLATSAALCALIVILGIPGLHLGFIQISPTVSVTIINIPVTIAVIFGGFWGAVATSFVFGLTSLVNAAVNPSGALDPLFVWPQISILPRVLFGLISYAIFFAGSSVLKIAAFSRKKSSAQKEAASKDGTDSTPPLPQKAGNTGKFIVAALTAFIGTWAHSWITLGALFLFMGEATTKALGGLGYGAFLIVNLPGTLRDCILATLVTMGVMGSIFISSNKKSKLNVA